MTKSTKIIAAFALAASIGSFGAIQAQQERGASGARPEGRGGRPDAPPFGGGLLHPGAFRELNLTDAQKEQIQKLQEAARAESETTFTKLRETDSQLRALVQAGTFDEAAARTLLNQKAAAQVELELVRLRTDAAIYNLLTAEQKTQLEQLRQQRPERGGRGNFRPDAPPPSN